MLCKTLACYLRVLAGKKHDVGEPLAAGSDQLKCIAFGFAQLVKEIELGESPYDISVPPDAMRSLHRVDARLTQYAFEPDQQHFDALMHYVSLAVATFPWATELDPPQQPGTGANREAK